MIKLLHSVMRHKEKQWREWARLRWYAADTLRLLLGIAIVPGLVLGVALLIGILNLLVGEQDGHD